MGIQKVAFNFMVERGGKLAKSLLCSKPIPKPIDFKGLKYVPQLEKDTVQVSKVREEIYYSSKFEHPKYIWEQDIADFKPPKKYEPFFNFLKTQNYRPDMKIFIDGVGNERFCFWASLCKYAPDKFEILYPSTKMTLKSKEDFLCNLFDGYKRILKIDSKELKDIVKGIDGYNQIKLEELNDAISEKDLVRFIIQTFEERCRKDGRIKIVVASLKKIVTRDKDAIDCTDAYITCSNQFRSGENKAKLHKYLNQFEYIEDSNWCRGEQTPYMFDKIDISEDLSNYCRKLIKKNKEKALEVHISANDGAYGGFSTINLHEYIISKEKLSLADAMMVMKYGDYKFHTKVIEAIKSSKVIDDKFKSFGDPEFCYNWMNSKNGNTCVFQNATLKKGYHGIYRARGGQSEFIMSDDLKEITFQNVKYDPMEDVFHVDSKISTLPNQAGRL
ncbi:hypothetical protein J6I39_02665 [bacterium]|nr:hypothetical protein [bacterium]